ncbi:hypothetical protein BaRGS_00022635 [Batillaria attramentaria]|uniref:Lysine-specific metallo-endopeptidase domain-containing protein n=1 Tax=Batillaria attramentaria TaxID=370345 RepID=A0ABD0KG80_9CAEN|nr:hypothetical protein BaRGS_033507 [Batillaria attramentaria]
MLRHSPSHIFTNIANHPGSGVGVFTLAEKITVFPECYHLADTPACKGRCDGSCSHTCTFDGRKYETLSGVTNSKSIVAVENVLCASRDPYHHHDNILVHEFAHTVNRLGMSSSEKSQLTAAYNHAKAHHLWRDGSYAMATQGEYFAEGTGAFFLVNLQSTTGGMTDCSGGKCRTEMQARDHIQAKDPQLATILSHVYTNGHIHTASGIKVCPT